MLRKEGKEGPPAMDDGPRGRDREIPGRDILENEGNQWNHRTRVGKTQKGKEENWEEVHRSQGEMGRRVVAYCCRSDKGL